MKINNEELQSLLGLDKYRNKEAASGQSQGLSGFDALFQAQIQGQIQAQDTASQASTEAEQNAALLPQAQVGALTALHQAQSLQAQASQVQAQVAESLESSLNSLEDLASQLQSTASDSLKQAWAALDSLDGQLSQLRQQVNSLPGQHQEIDSLLDEMEVLSVTERAKFNRGDYQEL